MLLRLALLAGLLLSLAPPALADGAILDIITRHDRDRLDHFEATKQEALKEARQDASASDLATLEAILSRTEGSFRDFDMTGDWQCRTIKVGGVASLVVYDWFRCRVSDDGSGWVLEKLSGSQRTKGRFFTESDTRLTYLGAYFVAGDARPAYGAGPETDMAGYAMRSGSDNWYIAFPAPARESKLDILEFRR